MKTKGIAGTGEPILVTGGAGYIGSHVVRDLGEKGYRPVVLDNLSSGKPGAVLAGELVRGDVADAELVGSLLRRHAIRSVMHFAAYIQVGESVVQPLKYYENNSFNCLQPAQGLPGERGGKLHLLLDRRRLRHAQEGPGRRKGRRCCRSTPTAAPSWSARCCCATPPPPTPASATSPCATSTPPAPTARRGSARTTASPPTC